MTELEKTYDAKKVDVKWYQFWEENAFFKANPDSAKISYSISIPPPNVTGVLHMGHALVNTLQDILIRWKRMSGYETLWIPGTDHAGIATQTVVERHLKSTTGKRRSDFTREEFLEHVWEWKEDNEHRILNQLKKLGCSCDWSRLRFTMDKKNNRSVKKMFKTLYNEGLIYRGDYLVNWDPVTQTALADDEVEYEERQGFMWHFKYPLKEGSGYVRIATTRPETMLGDTAVAVSPSDQRYEHMIGDTVILPLMEREIPILSDHYVDPEFGTGMVKITPAHDPNDYQIGLRHNLTFINIMTPDGKINENGGKYAGLTMEEARHAVVKDMEELGFLEKVEPHENRVGISYRSKATIEPFLSKQWFIKMSHFKEKMHGAVEKGLTKLAPKNWENTYNHWIENLRDWCISRQLWWGHRIPIWYRKSNPEEMICYDGEGVPPEVEKSPEEWIQDEDVLDTWFSSALWPFANLGWPEHTPDLKKFYPNSVLVTGHDILFFWVARMIMMGEFAMGEVPFPEVFLHGLIYGKSYWRKSSDGGIDYLGEKERREYDLGKPVPNDVHSKWEKMSKSKGNIIDPLEIIEEYGTDAMRMALCASATQAREIDLDRRRFEEFKNFTNKIWNGARFVFMNLEGLKAEQFSAGIDMSLLALEDRWILSVLNRTIRDVNDKLGQYLFDQSALEAYDFFWKEFCSYYVEISKPILFGKIGTPEERLNKQKLLVVVLCQAIRLMHPMAPFITEELFHLLKTQLKGVELNSSADPYTEDTVRSLNSASCLVAPYPQVVRESDVDQTINDTFDLVGKIVYAVRNIRGEMKVPPTTPTDVHIIGSQDTAEWKTINENRNIITALVRVNQIEMHTQEPDIGFVSTGVVGSLKVMVPIPEEMRQQEKSRLIKEKERLFTSLEKIRQQLQNENFTSRAPKELVDKQRKLLESNEIEIAEIVTKLDKLS